MKKYIKSAISKLMGDPCERWMVCLYALGCKDRQPYPMLCKWRFGKPCGYDFFAMVGPFESEKEAKAACAKCIEKEQV